MDLRPISPQKCMNVIQIKGNKFSLTQDRWKKLASLVTSKGMLAGS